MRERDASGCGGVSGVMVMALKSLISISPFFPTQCSMNSRRVGSYTTRAWRRLSLFESPTPTSTSLTSADAPTGAGLTAPIATVERPSVTATSRMG